MVCPADFEVTGPIAAVSPPIECKLVISFSAILHIFYDLVSPDTPAIQKAITTCSLSTLFVFDT
jgi:hypothetical protein